MKIIRYIAMMGWLLSGALAGCDDLQFGTALLEKPVSDEMSIDSIFSKKQYADQALNQFYKSLPDFMPAGANQAHILDVFSDLGFTTIYHAWYTGDATSSTDMSRFPYRLTNGEICGNPTYGIRKAYIYIDNVDRVPDMTAEEKRIRKAEAKAVIGCHYVQMIRFFGGMPWIDHAYTPDENCYLPRLTLEETVNKTVALLDEAAADLPWYTTDVEYGHMTAAAAKALKFRLLHFVASPLFNSTQPYLEGPAASERLSWYGGYDVKRWEAALEAGREFLHLNESNSNYYQVCNTGEPQDAYVNGYFVKGNHEVILPTFRWATYSSGNKAYRMYDQGYGMPRGNYADMFQWKDGSTFDWNNPEHRAHPFFDENGKPTRDARMYETLLVNGDKYAGRKAEVYVGGREGYGAGSSVGSKTQYGYGFRKFIRDKSNEMSNKPYSCPFIRMPEVYLGIAESMNQLGLANSRDEFGRTAYDYLNLVHQRAGMPEVTSNEVTEGEALLNYLLDERAREYGQEDCRYFDLVRYKKGVEWAARPMETLTTTKNADGSFNYVVEVRSDIKYYWRDYWYLMPFPTAEIDKQYGLIQNPGWD